MKTIGIIGGMGPLATADLFEKLVRLTDAPCDQDHIHTIVDSNPSIPDRTAAILSGGESPVPALVRSAQRLEAAGAELLVMACNTAHYFYDQVAASVSIPILHIARETAACVQAAGLSSAALLATDGTVKAGVYEKAFRAAGLDLMHPNDEEQAAVMDVIYKGIKAGNDAFNPAPMQAALTRLEKAGAPAFILGCTELPIAFVKYGLKGRVIDPTSALAMAAIRAAGGHVRAQGKDGGEGCLL
ncbi:MAG: amino acid racemase [Candidatus Pelethousia sp.]|nr:amino acid racemase [Candidatus Pelethousia sp.]